MSTHVSPMQMLINLLDTSQKDIADRIGVSRSSIGAMARGTNKGSYNTRIKIMRVYGIHPCSFDDSNGRLMTLRRNLANHQYVHDWMQLPTNVKGEVMKRVLIESINMTPEFTLEPVIERYMRASVALYPVLELYHNTHPVSFDPSSSSDEEE